MKGEDFMNKTNRNIAVYIRTNSKGGNDFQVKLQKESIEKYLIDQKNIGTVTYYIDNGFSGTNLNRPSLNKMIKDIESKKINKVIVKDYSRISRNSLDLLKCIREYFKPNDVELISIQDNNENIEMLCMLYAYSPIDVNEWDTDYDELEDE